MWPNSAPNTTCSTCGEDRARVTSTWLVGAGSAAVSSSASSSSVAAFVPSPSANWTAVTRTLWNVRWVMLGDWSSEAGRSNGSKERTTPTVSPTLSEPPTARVGSRETVSSWSPAGTEARPSWLGRHEPAAEQLLAGLEVDGGDEILVEGVQVGDGVVDQDLGRHLGHLDRLRDLPDGRALRNGVADHVDVDQRLGGDGLVLGRLDVDDEGGGTDAGQHQGGQDADDLALHGSGCPCHGVLGEGLASRSSGRRAPRSRGRSRSRRS